jgi:hypothetical protein
MSESIDLLRIDGADDFINGTSASNFQQLEEGFYDQCKVCGYVIDTASFEGHDRKLFHLIWQIKNEDTVYVKLGAGWTLPLSCNEKARFRQDILKWFNKTSWTDACDILVKGGILVKAEDGSATFDMYKFFGKFGRICVKEAVSAKTGKKYAKIDSISPAKKKEEFDFDAVPEFMVSGDKVVTYKLADGVKVKKVETKQETSEVATTPTPTPKVTQVDANEFLNRKPSDPDLPF